MEHRPTSARLFVRSGIDEAMLNCCVQFVPGSGKGLRNAPALAKASRSNRGACSPRPSAIDAALVEPIQLALRRHAVRWAKGTPMGCVMSEERRRLDSLSSKDSLSPALL